MSNENIPLRIHSIAQVEAYQVTSEELEALAREGANVGLDFQVSLFCLTVAVSFLIALLTTRIDSRKTFDIFVILVVVDAILGVVFAIKWARTKGSFSAIVERTHQG